MKAKILLVVFYVLSFKITDGQEFTSEIVSTGGEDFSNEHYRLCWTIGEPVTLE